MAVILKTNDEENGYYQKIILENCYINIDGLYVETIVFKNKTERDKDKSRQLELKNFIDNFNSKLSEIENIEDEELKNKEIEEFSKVKWIANILMTGMYIGSIDDPSTRTELIEDFVLEAEKYGFKKEWYNNPVVIVRRDQIRVEEYKGQNFNLAEFYQSLKRSIYTDKDGKLLVEDDL
jgi:hypothetical protein